jgi:DNA-binding response OmpR family regulator
MAKRILIVDDEVNIRNLYRQEFEDEGYLVDTAASPEEADEIMEKQSPHLMILDIELSGQDGLSYLREVMQANRNLQVVISSAYSSYKDEFSSWLAEAYIVKSSDLEPLKQKVQELLEREAS